MFQSVVSFFLRDFAISLLLISEPQMNGHCICVCLISLTATTILSAGIWLVLGKVWVGDKISRQFYLLTHDVFALKPFVWTCGIAFWSFWSFCSPFWYIFSKRSKQAVKLVNCHVYKNISPLGQFFAQPWWWMVSNIIWVEWQAIFLSFLSYCGSIEGIQSQLFCWKNLNFSDMFVVIKPVKHPTEKFSDAINAITHGAMQHNKIVYFLFDAPLVFYDKYWKVFLRLNFSVSLFSQPCILPTQCSTNFIPF